MTAFVTRSLSVGETLGDKLRRLREEERWTIADVAQRLRIAPKYLAALEGGRYWELPGDVYTRSFLKSYAEILNIQTDRVLALFEKELATVKPLGGAHTRLPPTAKNLRSFVTTHLMARLAIVGVLVAIVGYLAVQVYAILAPPKLAVLEPSGDFVTESRTIVVAGRTEPEATVTINGSETFVDREGYFEEVLALSPGTHTLEIAARRKRSRTAVVTRTVVVEQATGT